MIIVDKVLLANEPVSGLVMTVVVLSLSFPSTLDSWVLASCGGKTHLMEDYGFTTEREKPLSSLCMLPSSRNDSSGWR